MPNGTCRMCFKRAEVKEIVPDVPVCKACGYNINKQLDFFTYFGYGLQKLSSNGLSDQSERTELDLEAETNAKAEEDSSKRVERRVKTRQAGKDKG